MTDAVQALYLSGVLTPRLRRRLRQYRACRGSYNLVVRTFHRMRRLVDRDPVRVTTYLGYEFSYPVDSMIGRHVARHGDWDAILARIVVQAFPEDDPFICEVGSNIGASLLQILRGKPRATVLALEPSNDFRPFLERNLRAAGFSNVRVLPLFVGAQPGTTWLYNNETTASATGPEYADHEARGRQQVEVITLDQVLSAEPRVDFIKIDTDGFDFEVLLGAERTLRNHRPLLFFELAPGMVSDSQARLSSLQALGYERLICLSPGQHAAVIGVTNDPDRAVGWAMESGYCDVLSWDSTEPKSKARFAGLEAALARRA
jgi:FkbM family methyltransferase